MDTRLHLLESFTAHGSDGATYKVMAYEHMARDPTITTLAEAHWEPTGQSEYRLETGEWVDVRRDGSMEVATTHVALERDA